MFNFKVVKDSRTGKEFLETHLRGKALLTIPQLNKSTAFTLEERHQLGLMGKLPVHIETLEEQVKRAYAQFESYQTKLQKNIYLNNLHDKNQVLFYKLVKQHITEMIPTIYTPIVGNAVKEYSREFRQPRGLYISYPRIEHIDEILDNRTNPEIDLIVVSDGEGVLGIGDQGVGAMDIPIAKLMVYTLFGGINHLRTLPILLDVGTNNKELLDDPLYLGWHHARVSGKDYDAFIEKFVSAVKRKFPNVFLHWEDFGRENANHNLKLYRNKICTFNDDIQGTGVVTVAALLSAVAASNSQLTEQRIVVFGAGSAGLGITDQICDSMVRSGLTRQQARERFWLIDRQGLLTQKTEGMTPAQQPYARKPEETKTWQVKDPNMIGLEDVIGEVKPTVLIGCSAVTGAFTKAIVQTMAAHTQHPIIFPLSNPTERCEATPQDLFDWTDSKALVATGSPFDDVEYHGEKLSIAQCNNALAYPGIGLGIVAVKAKHVSDDMLWAACNALMQSAPIHKDPTAPLLPNLEDAHQAAMQIGIAVAQQAVAEGLAEVAADAAIEKLVKQQVWEPHYLPYRKSTE